MTTVPDDKQGVASAVNDATREIGAALGIALAGSILAAHYTTTLTPRLTQIPPPVRGPATASLGQALEVARRLGPAGNQLCEYSKAAFVDAMDASLLALALLVAGSAIVIGLWAPGRQDRQLRLVQRLKPTESAPMP